MSAPRRLRLLTLIVRSARRERGASIVEYVLLLALIALVCVAALHFMGGQTSNGLDSIGSSVAAAG